MPERGTDLPGPSVACASSTPVYSQAYSRDRLSIIFRFAKPSSVGLLLPADLTQRTGYESDLLHFDIRIESKFPTHPIRAQREGSQT